MPNLRSKTTPARPVTADADDFATTFRALQSSSDHHLKILRFHYEAPGCDCTFQKLADEMGYKSYDAINLHYGQFAYAVGRELGLTDPPTGRYRDDGSNQEGEPAWVFVLADWSDERGSNTSFVLRPAVVEAISQVWPTWVRGEDKQ